MQRAPRNRGEPSLAWAKNPLQLQLTVSVTNLYAATNEPVQICLADRVREGYGAGCDHATNAADLGVELNPRREYRLTLVSTNFLAAELNLAVRPPFQPLGRKGKEVLPRDYTVLIDRQPATTIYASTNFCTYYSNSWVIEVFDEKLVRWYTDDGSDDPGPAPGDGTPISLGPGRSLETNKTALDWSVSLGRLYDGLAAGRLRVREPGLTREIYTPANIYYTASSTNVRDQVELVTSADGALRQVKANQTFVDIVSTSANQTALKFYFPSQVATNKDAGGVYTNISGSPFVTWTLDNPEPATANKLNIVETRNGASRTNSLVFDPQSSVNTWTLRSGTGSEERVETRGVSFSTSPVTNRIETVTVKYATWSTPAYKGIETYRLYDWGWELKETRVDPDNDAGTANDLVTNYEFYEDAGQPESYSKSWITTFPDGYWEKRVYDPFTGLLLEVLHPNGNQANPTNAAPNDGVSEVLYYDWYDGYYSSGWHIWGLAGLDHILGGTSEGWDEVNVFQREWLGDFVSDAGDMFISSEHYYYDRFHHAAGNSTLIGSGILGKGYGGHPFAVYDGSGPKQALCMHGGTYNAATRTFTTNGTSAADGPDWRQSIITWGCPDHLSEPGEYDPIYVTALEGEPLYDHHGWQIVLLETNRVQKETRIFQNGSLVQRELSVFTGMNETNEPVFEVFQVFVYQNDTLGHPTNVFTFDPASPSVTRVVYQADWRGTNASDGDLLLWESDETGIRKTYAYDSLKRVTQVIQAGVTNTGFPTQLDVITSTSYDAAGRKLRETVTSGSLGLTNAWGYDLAGRQTASTNEQGLVTAVAYELGGRRVITTHPSGATEIRENYLDRRLASVTGTGVVHESHQYALDTLSASEPVLMDRVTYGPTGSTRWRRTGVNWCGQPFYWESQDYPGTNIIAKRHWYQTWLHQPEQITQSGAPDQLLYLDYDGAVGETTTATGYYAPTLGSLERVTRTLKGFAKQGGHWFKVQTNLTYLTDNDATPALVSITQERLSGFASSNILSQVTIWDADTNATVITAYVDRAARKVIQVTNTPQSTLDATNITLNGRVQCESTPTVAAPLWHYYDALGRETQVVSPLGFSRTVAYNQFGQVTNQTDFTGSSPAIEYYPNGVLGAGQVKCQTQSGKKTYYGYTSRGELHRSWGHVPYPEERVYSDYGELVELHTFRGGMGWSGATWPTNTAGAYDSTIWTYDEPSGLLAAKTDAQNRSVTYGYTNGVLWTRTWARQSGGAAVTLTNVYNDFGDLAAMDYSDGTASVEFNDYSRAGQPREIVDAVGAQRLLYDHASRLVASTYEDGLLAGVTLSNHFHAAYGRDALQVAGISTPITHQFGFDGYGRLSGVTNGAFTATYGYKPNSDLLQSTACKSNTTTVLTTTRTWEYGMRLGAILNEVNGVNVSSHSYTYDSLNRRTRATLEDGSYWQYGYNDRNELTGARRYWYDLAAVAGQQFGYDYDCIGNRRTAQSGGDTNGANLRPTGYEVNSLNHYTTITNLGYADVLGAALATNTVWVNDNAAERKGEYFRKELQVGNASGPLWTNVTVASGAVTNTGGLIVPDDRQALTYDLDGNLTFDGTWSYEWDAENRLRTMTMTNTVAGLMASNRLKLEFVYDFMNRRVQKIVSTNSTGSNFVPQSTNHFVYDGWNLVAILNPESSLLESFTWGQDLSGTMTKAGGIGGLLLVTAHGAANTNCFAGYDGNGNVMLLVNAGDKSTAARYEHSAFGETLRITGPLAKGNPFRFSTKFADDESGHVYYGWRYYVPELGRWLNRDPIEEQGGLNLSAFVANNPQSRVDADGRFFGLSLLERLIMDSTEIQWRTQQAAQQARIMATYATPMLKAIAWSPIVVIMLAAEFTATTSAAVYATTLVWLGSTPNGQAFLANAPSMFTGYFAPGLPDANLGGMLGATAANARAIGEAVFDAALDFWSSPDTE